MNESKTYFHLTDKPIEGKFELQLKKKTRYWIAYSPDFKTFGYSKSSDKNAIKDFHRALDLFFKIHTKRGTIIGLAEKLESKR